VNIQMTRHAVSPGAIVAAKPDNILLGAAAEASC